MKKSAPSAATTNRFCPFTVNQPSFSSARVVAPKKSEPPRGSVSASAEIRSPLSSGFRNFSFCSSVPKEWRAWPTIEGIEKAQPSAVPEDPHLLQGGDLGAPGEAAAAVLSVEAQAEEVALAQGLHEFAGVGDLVPVHLPDQVGGDLPLDELPDLRLQGDLFRGQTECPAACPSLLVE